jgi:hypothetical protein
MSEPNASTLTTYTITEVLTGKPVKAGVQWFREAYELAHAYHKDHLKQVVIHGPEPTTPEVEGEWFVGEADYDA